MRKPVQVQDEEEDQDKEKGTKPESGLSSVLEQMAKKRPPHHCEGPLTFTLQSRGGITSWTL